MYFAATDPSTLDINLYDSESFSLIGTLRGHEEHVYVLRFGVNNTKLATAENYAINVWDIQSMSLANNMKCPCAVGYMVFDGNGDSVLIAGCAGWFFILKWNLTTGSVLSMHVDTANTHVVSCIINVDQEVEEDWKLVILDHEENEHSITMRPGDMLLYESAKLLHGRPSKCRCCS
jgi:WD40 repeat protein